MTWRPATLKTRFIFGTALICALLIAGVEVVLQISNRNNGLIFADENGRFPSYTLFCFEYLPTLISILHSLIWICIDHDLRRAEPFFQLSKPGGATAKESLLLDYPYQFVLAVGWSSFKRRHWAVFCGTMIGIIGSFIATPLMPAIFTQESTIRTLDFAAVSHALRPMERQHLEVSSKFTRNMYRHKYLRDPLPPFANESLAIQLFDTDITPFTNETWFFPGTVYETELECETAVVHMNGTDTPKEPAIRTFVSSRNCNHTFESDVEFTFINSHLYTYIMMTHAETTYVENYKGYLRRKSHVKLSDRDCPNRRMMFALVNRDNYNLVKNGTKDAFVPINPIMADALTYRHVPNNASAIFCEPRYYSRSVEAVVEAKTGALLRVDNIADRINIDDRINNTHLLDLATVGITAPPGIMVTKDLDGADYDPFGFPHLMHIITKRPQFRLLNQPSRPYFPQMGSPLAEEGFDVQNLVFSMPGSTGQSLSIFAISELQNAEELMDPKRLADIFNGAYKMFFAFAVANDLTEPVSDNQITVKRTHPTRAYLVDNLFARLLQAAWATLLVLAICIYFVLRRRPLNLSSDPGSLAALMASVADSPALLADFEGSEFLKYRDTAEILKQGSNHRYQLKLLGNAGHRLEMVNNNEKPLPATPPIKDRMRNGVVTAEPLELSLPLGLTACFLFLIMIGAFTALRVLDTKRDGISIAYMSEFVQKLAFSYTPTLAATGVEMFIVFVTRYVSLIAPYETMRTSRARHSNSISAYYERTPPHFLLFKALRNSHFLLAATISCIILANVMTVALGGIFLPMEKSVSRPISVSRTKSPLLNGTAITYLDFRVGETSMYYPIEDKNATLPPWITDEFYILPFNHTDDSASTVAAAQNLTAETWGIGVVLNCTLADETQVQKKHYAGRYDAWTQRVSTIRPPDIVDPDKEFGYVSTAHTVEISPYGMCPGAWNSSKQIYWNYRVSTWSEHIAELGLYNHQDTAFWDHLERWWNAEYIHHELLHPFAACPGIFAVGFAKYKVKHHPQNSTGYMNGSIIAENVFDSEPALLCRSTLRISKLLATVDKKGYVKKTTVISDVKLDQTNNTITPHILRPTLNLGRSSNATFSELASTVDAFLHAFNHQVMKLNDKVLRIRRDDYPQSWLSYLTLQEMKEEHRRDNSARLYQPQILQSEIAPALSAAYTKVFALWLRTFEDLLFVTSPEANEVIIASANVVEERMRVSMEMWILAIISLATLTVVLGIFYTWRPGRSLPHIPTTMAATIPYIYASNMLKDLREAQAQRFGKKEFQKWLDTKNWRYQYGYFMGGDGKQHLGVNKESASGEDCIDMGTERDGVRMGLLKSGRPGYRVSPASSQETLVDEALEVTRGRNESTSVLIADRDASPVGERMENASISDHLLGNSRRT